VSASRALGFSIDGRERNPRPGKQGAIERQEVIICSALDAQAPHATERVENAKERTMGRVV